jgi:hypothetical protein
MNRRLFIIISSLLLFALLLIPVSAVGGDQGWYRIESNVAGAAVYFDSEYKGTTPCVVPVYVTGTPYQTVRVQKSGYYPAEQTLLPVPAAGETRTVYVTLYPVPQQGGSIQVTSSPSNANVYLNGVYKGRTPQTIPNLAVGNYQVKVTKTGYTDWVNNNVYVYAGQTSNVYASLIEEPTYGSISVTTSPSGAHIFLDGGYMGSSPKTLTQISPGNHLIELELAGYQEWSGNVYVYSNQVTYVSRSLSPNPQPTTGSIVICSTPPGAYVYLDGKYEGVAQPGCGTVINDVAPGTHTLKMTLTGYEDYVDTVQVNSGQTTHVSVTLTQEGVQTGSIKVESSPAGASVYVDDAVKGITPVTVTDVEPGTRKVTLTLEGYQEWSTSVTVSAGGISSVSATLNPVPTPTPASPLTVLAALGIVGLFLAVRLRKE